MSTLQDDLNRLQQRKDAEEAEQARQEYERKAPLYREAEAREAEERQNAYNEKLEEHQLRFKCHICGTPSSGPQYDHGEFQSDPEHDGRSRSGISGTWVRDAGDDWNEPTGLKMCDMCKEWACNSHIVELTGPHNDWFATICTECGQDLLSSNLTYPEWKKQNS